MLKQYISFVPNEPRTRTASVHFFVSAWHTSNPHETQSARSGTRIKCSTVRSKVMDTKKGQYYLDYNKITKSKHWMRPSIYMDDTWTAVAANVL